MLVRKDGLELPRGKRWWREVGWRHMVGLAGVAFAGFPVLYIISRSIPPLRLHVKVISFCTYLNTLLILLIHLFIRFILVLSLCIILI